MMRKVQIQSGIYLSPFSTRLAAETTLWKRRKEVKEWMVEDTWKTKEEKKTVKRNIVSTKFTRIADKSRE